MSKILIVDDDRLLQNSLRTILSEKYDPLIAGSGEDAIRLLTEKSVDLVLLDIRLPGMDGIETGGVISAAMEWYEKGLITTKETGGLELEWGNAEVVSKLIGMMAMRKGFGDILADGASRAADHLGLGDEVFSKVNANDLLCAKLRKEHRFATSTAT